MTRAWRIRAWGEQDLEQAFVGQGVIAISADDIGDASGLSDEAIRAKLRSAHPDRSGAAISTFVGYWRAFVSEMQFDDVVALPLARRRVAVGLINGPYDRVASEPNVRLRNARTVQWLRTIDRDQVDEDLRRGINAPGTLWAFRSPDAAERLLLAAGRTGE